MTVLTSSTTAATLSETDVVAYLADLDGAGTASFTGYNDGEVGCFAVTDGTDVGISHVIDSDAADAIVAADIVLVVTLRGVTIGSLTAANFADFL